MDEENISIKDEMARELNNFWRYIASVHRLASMGCDKCFVKQYAIRNDWYTPLCAEGCAEALRDVHERCLDEAVGLLPNLDN